MEKKKYLYEKVLICNYTGIYEYNHVLNEPVQLPCSCSLCYKCLINAINRHELYDRDEKVFKCVICGVNSIIENIQKLPPNAYLIDLFHQNIKHIAKEVIMRHKITTETLKQSNFI